MTDTQRSLYCFGLGYSAMRLAERMLARGWRVGGTVRGDDKAETLQTEGIAADVWDGQGLVSPPVGSDWVISVPPDEGGCPVFASAGSQAASANSITYLSTTGVYGDLGGGWAFEWTPINPQSKRAENRVRAEQQWLSTGQRVSLVRLPGIYGPGRSPLDRVRKGEARRIVKPGQVFSRVHVDDIASGLEALLLTEREGGVFHLCDDEPAPPQDVIAHAACLLGVDPPPEVEFDDADLSPMARSFYAECKRVSNARAKAALGWRPAYPTYRDGLSAILKAETC